MNYGWIITKDHLAKAGERSCKGINGPSSCTAKPLQLISHPKGQAFRMLDDDREVYCEGILVDYDGECSLFEPLEDYGYGGLGCTIIQYKDNGVWEDL